MKCQTAESQGGNLYFSLNLKYFSADQFWRRFCTMSVRSCSLHFRFSSVFIFRSICWAVIVVLSWFSTVSRCWWLMAMEYFILEASVLHIGKPFAGFSFQCLHIAHQFCWMVSIVFHFLQEYQLNLFCPIMANVSFLWTSSKRKINLDSFSHLTGQTL